MLNVIVILLLLPSVAVAQIPWIATEPMSQGTRIEQVLSAKVGFAAIQVKGTGDRLRMTYSSSAEIQGFILYLKKNGAFEISEAVSFKLPKGNQVAAYVPLHNSVAWKTRENSYKLILLSEDEDAVVDSLLIERSAHRTILSTFLKHLTISETFSPSSYHRLKGYRALGIPLTMIFGPLVIALALIHRKRAEAILVTGILVYNARFAVDLLFITQKHLTEWYGEETYGASGSLHHAASDITGASQVTLCTNGSSFAASLLRYHLYPTKIVENTLTGSSHAIVFQSLESSWKEGILRCSEGRSEGKLMKQYSDGTLLIELKS